MLTSSDILQDRVAAGLGRAARRLGAPAEAYRPRDAAAPLAPRNRFLRLDVAFHAGKGFDTPPAQDAILWQAMLDSAYTRPGDYLVQRGATWFIASQPRLLPVQCIRTNRVVSFTRAVAPDHVGAAGYAGPRRDALAPVLSLWPASMLTAGTPHPPAAHLPADRPLAHWTLRLPALPVPAPRAGDRMTDDLGRAGIVAATDETEHGWRLAVREAAT